MSEFLVLWGAKINRPISVSEASILWCDVQPPKFFDPSIAEEWVTNPLLYNDIFTRINIFFNSHDQQFIEKHRLISEILVKAILSGELKAEKWDNPGLSSYHYDHFNTDLTTVTIKDLSQWSIDNNLNPAFLQKSITALKKNKNKHASKKIDLPSDSHKELIKESFYKLLKSSDNTKLPSYKDVIENMIKTSSINNDTIEYNGLLIKEPPPKELWLDFTKIIFYHSQKVWKKPYSIKSIKNYITKLKKEYQGK